MKNFYYTTEITKKIKEVLDTELPLTVKNINIGGFRLLPAPEVIKEYLPAVFIEPIEIDTESANEVLDIEAEQYPFQILYTAPYSYETQEEMLPKIKEAELIANVLRATPVLSSFRIDPSETEAGGMVVYRRVRGIRFDNISTELFAQIKVPACVVQIDFDIFFRTFAG
jgi:hypothetical protein